MTRGRLRVSDVELTKKNPHFEVYSVLGNPDLGDMKDEYEVAFNVDDDYWNCSCTGRNYFCSHITAAQLVGGHRQ